MTAISNEAETMRQKLQKKKKQKIFINVTSEDSFLVTVFLFIYEHRASVLSLLSFSLSSCKYVLFSSEAQIVLLHCTTYITSTTHTQGSKCDIFFEGGVRISEEFPFFFEKTKVIIKVIYDFFYNKANIHLMMTHYSFSNGYKRQCEKRSNEEIARQRHKKKINKLK